MEEGGKVRKVRVSNEISVTLDNFFLNKYFSPIPSGCTYHNLRIENVVP